jgi:leucyl aminopeptidase (aminopeptidase T)
MSQESKLVNLLFDYSLQLSSKDRLVIDVQPHAVYLIDFFSKECSSRKISFKIFYRKPCVDLEDLQHLEEMVDWCSAYLKIGGDIIKKSKNQKEIHLKEGEIREKRCKKKWVLVRFPSVYMSKNLKKPLEKLRKMFFASCFIDWEKQRKMQLILAEMFKFGEVYIVSNDTNLRFYINSVPTYGYGLTNMPDGEIAWFSLFDSVEGKIYFPTRHFFKEFKLESIFLEFKKGKIYRAKSKNQKSLDFLLSLDDLSRYMGEFGIGTNTKIKLVGDSFFDEKVLGTIHLALGGITPTYASALHLDLVKDLRNNGKIYVNGKKVYEGGKWLY